MFCKAKVAVCSEIRTKHINAMWAPRRMFYCQTWSYVKLPLGFERLREEHRLSMLENRMLRKIFGSKKEEIINMMKKTVPLDIVTAAFFIVKTDVVVCFL
jgi:hypothetical protein